MSARAPTAANTSAALRIEKVVRIPAPSLLYAPGHVACPDHVVRAHSPTPGARAPQYRRRAQHGDRDRLVTSCQGMPDTAPGRGREERQAYAGAVAGCERRRRVVPVPVTGPARVPECAGARRCLCPCRYR
ncbi:hypothetical protein GCM10010504_30710 [Streptomyces griseus]|nr:hypothetical protein GCM10010504_30710 [Streptomyces griseus]